MARQKRADAPERVRTQRAPLNMKTSPELRRRIEEAAEANGLSLTQEVERRLVRSFELDDGLGGSDQAGLLRLLGAVLTSLNSRTGKDWLEDYDTWFQARVIAGALLDRVAPPSAEEEDLSRLHKKAFARKPDASAAEEWSRRDGEARARRLGLLENAAEQAAAVVLDLPKFTRTK